MARPIQENSIPVIYFASDGFPYCGTCADELDERVKATKGALYIAAADTWDSYYAKKCFVCKRSFTSLPGVSIVACDEHEKKRAERKTKSI